MTCRLARQEPSLTSRKLKPPLLSRRVRIQPWTRTLWPIAAAWRAALMEIFSMGFRRGSHGWNTDRTRILGQRGWAVNLTQRHRDTEVTERQVMKCCRKIRTRLSFV